MRIGQFREYKGYFGSIEYDHKDGLYYGKLLYIRDLVNYHADNIVDLEKQYHDAVDDYICFKKEIEKGYKKMDENRYNTKVRLAMSERLKKCNKDKYEAERRIIDINDAFLTKAHELSYNEACELIEERKRLEKDVERLTIELDIWYDAREICMDIADEIARE